MPPHHALVSALKCLAASFFLYQIGAQRQPFADLNSLQAFLPAISANNLIHSSVTGAQNISSSSAADDTRDEYENDTRTRNERVVQLDRSTEEVHDPRDNAAALRKRDGDCGSYNSCDSLGAASLCCAPDRICSADALGRIGCCPVGAACTGTIPGAGGVIPTVTTTITSTQTPTTTQSSTVATTTEDDFPTGGGFVIAGSSTVVILGDGNHGSTLRPPQVFRMLAEFLAG